MLQYFAILGVLLLCYHVYFLYNVCIVVPKHGFRYFKLPFSKKVYMIQTLHFYDDLDNLSISDKDISKKF